MMRKCIIRDLGNVRDTTAPMNCDKAMNMAKAGEWCENWSLEECIENTEGSAPILQVAIQFKNGKLEFTTQDEFFKSICI